MASIMRMTALAFVAASALAVGATTAFAQDAGRFQKMFEAGRFLAATIFRRSNPTPSTRNL